LTSCDAKEMGAHIMTDNVAFSPAMMRGENSKLLVLTCAINLFSTKKYNFVDQSALCQLTYFKIPATSTQMAFWVTKTLPRSVSSFFEDILVDVCNEYSIKHYNIVLVKEACIHDNG
jgi:hypothetical protein